jgi:hypothetical protein
VGDKRAFPQQIKGARDELAQFVPEQWQTEQTNMHCEQRKRKEAKGNQQVIRAFPFRIPLFESQRGEFRHGRPALRRHRANY